jgi:hypothetical protein
MKFVPKFVAPRLNLSSYRKALHRHMLDVVSQAINVWLEAVLMEIPVWSGASRATFTHSAQVIHYNIPITPVVQSRVGTGIGEGAGGLEADDNKGRYVFHYSTSLPWLVWNEYHNANVDPDPTLFYRVIKEGPYNFQMKGFQAFRSFASTVDLPPVAPHIQPVRVKV